MQNCLAIFLFSSFLFCSKSYEEKLKIGKIYNPYLVEYSQQDIDYIYSILKIIFSSIQTKNLSHLLNYILEDKGVFSDLKSHRTKEEFIREINNTEGFLYNYYLNTKKLREITNDNTQISLYDLIHHYNLFILDYYFVSDSDCEVKILIKENEKESYRFNNPYFIKANSKWYIYRIP